VSDSNKPSQSGKLHLDEVDIDLSLARRLIANQFPLWAKLPVEPFPSAGTENMIYRLGDDMAIRLPRTPGAEVQLAKEHRWLPRLAPLLPLAIPIPLARGAPAEKYPSPWSVYRWLPGENMTLGPLANLDQGATEMAHFVAALQQIDTTGGPPPGRHNFFRGEPLAKRDEETRAAVTSLQGIINSDLALVAWEEALKAPAWSGPPVWIHGDLLPSNLLVVEGELSAVIDFGGLAVGDPACDLIVAWSTLSASTRHIFRATLGVDEATWARGRGWALSFGLIALPYYQVTNPELAGIARTTIDEVLADHAQAG
jgi:aminoglycoside phosphotransferase (APT) family kinase protein